ncbi:MAG: diphosphomevalonate decarboxylase, partial [Pseudomonadota bacterium]
MIKPEDVFRRVIPQALSPPCSSQAYAPANIALSKYWGKRDITLNLPLNSSLSVSLGTWGTTTQIDPAEADTLVFNGKDLPANAPEAAKIWRFVDLFCGDARPALAINTRNSIPTAAGLASSASGFAALTRALAQTFAVTQPPEILSMLSRFGSGSATRSFWTGFARWDRGQRDDGTDSHGRALDVHYPEFQIAIVPVDTAQKSHSSRQGMTHTVSTSPLYAVWPQQAETDCDAIETALLAKDFDTLGTLAEANALAMHATMMAARPALMYLKASSWRILETLRSARRDGLRAFATMDAGPNVKLLFL